MKNIILILFILIVGCASVDLTDKQNVFDLKGQSKKQLYQKSIQWITYKFASGRAVIDYKDPDMGRIIAKGNVYLDSFMGGVMYVNLIATIDAVNGRAKISIHPAGCVVGSRLIDCPCNSSYLTPTAMEKLPEVIIDFINDYTGYMTGGQGPEWDGKS